jgi:hypothetical protein
VRTIAFVDVETVGLDPRQHGIWEVGLILYTPPDADGKSPDDEEYVWQLPVDVASADPASLSISRYYERRWDPLRTAVDYDAVLDRVLAGVDRFGHPELAVPSNGMDRWAARFAALTAGCVVAGMVPSFDMERLDLLLRDHGAAPAWHYRPICVETLAVGCLYGRGDPDVPEYGWKPDEKRRRDVRSGLPWSSAALLDVFGVSVPDGERHTALGDARAALNLYQAVAEPT